MHRLLIALLAALDAIIAAAGGIAVVFAPLTLLWVFGLDGGADWGALWPASGAIWQAGHLVAQTVTLPEVYLATAGIDPAAATFTLSLAPLALAVFTAGFAARSGRRAAEAGAPLIGATAGTLVFAAAATVVALTVGNPIVSAEFWPAVLLPTLVFAVPALLGAVVTAWRVDVDGPISRLRERVARLPRAWAVFPALLLRGTAVTTTGLVGAGAIVTAVAVFTGGADVVALFEAANVDITGGLVLSLAQLAYFPTLVLWGASFVAGPGFALGAGTAVSPAGTEVGVVPGIPVLGAVPDSTTTWLLLLALVPIALGAFAGWMLRSRLADQGRPRHDDADGGIGMRLVLTVSLAVLTGGVAAVFAVVSSGSIGPGRLAMVGPEPGPLALAVGIETLVGAAILLLSPRRTRATPSTPGEATQRKGSADLPAHPGLWRSISAPPMYVHSGSDEASDPAPVVTAAADPEAAESVDDNATEPLEGLRGSDDEDALTEPIEPLDGFPDRDTGRAPGSSVD
ncbi:DUF6350 family protein [Microbacterium sp. P05]|uniref:cell division protein PerM n=1 Tax=Microbacterium sp. P05 TaxID=3366948 RepID=UPI003745B584